MLSRSNTEKSWVPAESEIETSAGNPQSAVPVMHKLPLPDWLRRGTSLKRESDDSSDELHVVVTGHIDVYQAKPSLHNRRKQDYSDDESVTLVNGQEHKPLKLMRSPSFHDNPELGLSLAAPSQVVTEEDNEDCSYGNELLAKPENSTD